LPRVNVLEWVRLPGDELFILGGALPLVWLSWQGLRYPNARRVDAETELPRMLFTYEADTQQR
jgi:nitric oxide reductase subunit B